MTHRLEAYLGFISILMFASMISYFIEEHDGLAVIINSIIGL